MLAGPAGGVVPEMLWLVESGVDSSVLPLKFGETKNFDHSLWVKAELYYKFCPERE